MRLSVLTFNLRYPAPDPPERRWEIRRPQVSRLIAHHAPDIIGTQEGNFGPLRQIADDLSEYEWVGTGRDGGSRGEFMAIFYKRARFTPVSYDHFWLSDTPDRIGSSTWGNNNRRMVTRVTLRERGGDRIVHLLNTHFDFDDDWHEKAAKLLLARTNDLPENEASILTGDFNAAARDSLCHATILSGGWRDSWDEAPTRGPEIGTFHGYGPIEPGGARIDWILLKGPVRTRAVRVLTDGAETDETPSDHFPVLAELEIQ